MAWAALIVLSMVVWAACGQVIYIGRRRLPMQTTLMIHLFLSAVFAFTAAAVHVWLWPEFGALERAAAMTGLIVALDAAVVAPLFERSYAMFRSLLGTWVPFVAIFVASWAAGIYV